MQEPSATLPKSPYAAIAAALTLEQIDTKIETYKEQLAKRTLKINASIRAVNKIIREVKKRRADGLTVPRSLTASIKDGKLEVEALKEKQEALKEKIKKLRDAKKSGTKVRVVKRPAAAATPVRRPAPKPTKPAPVKPAPVKPAPVKPAPVKETPEPAKVPTKLDRVHAEDRALQRKVGNPKLFGGATTRPKQLKYVQAMWEKCNRILFGSKLSPPRIELIKAVDIARFRKRGDYSPRSRVLRVSPNLFGVDEAYVLTTLVHEMCHQANYDLDKQSLSVNPEEGGHGPIWQKRMREVGLTPARFDKYTAMDYADDATRAKFQNTIDLVNDKTSVVPPSEFRNKAMYMVVATNKKRESHTVPGMLLGTVGSGSKRGRLYVAVDNAGLDLRGVFLVEPGRVRYPSRAQKADLAYAKRGLESIAAHYEESLRRRPDYRTLP